MKFKFDGYNHIVRLEKGELLIECLTKLFYEQKLPSCWIVGLGGAAWAELGFYHLEKKEYEWKKLNQPLEILSLQGNVAWDNDQPVFHFHGSFSDDKLQSFGGHIKELEVAGTCEIMLHKWYGDKLTRCQDDVVGLKLLDI